MSLRSISFTVRMLPDNGPESPIVAWLFLDLVFAFISFFFAHLFPQSRRRRFRRRSRSWCSRCEDAQKKHGAHPASDAITLRVPSSARARLSLSPPSFQSFLRSPNPPEEKKREAFPGKQQFLWMDFLFPFFPKRKQLSLDDNESLNSVILGLVWTNERIESIFFSKPKARRKSSQRTRLFTTKNPQWTREQIEFFKRNRGTPPPKDFGKSIFFRRKSAKNDPASCHGGWLSDQKRPIFYILFCSSFCRKSRKQRDGV